MKETLEEAAENYARNETDATLKLISKYSFQDGAKWQQERMYSEAIEFAEWIRIKDFQPDSLIKSNIVGGLGVWSGESYFTSKDNWIGLDMKYYTTEELFEQFKKKV